MKEGIVFGPQAATIKSSVNSISLTLCIESPLQVGKRGRVCARVFEVVVMHLAHHLIAQREHELDDREDRRSRHVGNALPSRGVIVVAVPMISDAFRSSVLIGASTTVVPAKLGPGASR